jgi:aryl-alcohol dehydrogenase (NADP+)
MIPLCRDQGIGVIPWSPLARGFLAGNRRREDKGETTRSRSDAFAHRLYYGDDDFKVVERVTEIAARRGVPNAQVALAWLLHKPGITAPIVGATRPNHIADALAAVDLVLDADEIKALEEPYRPHPVLGHD